MAEPQAGPARLTDRYQFLEAIRHETPECFSELIGHVHGFYDSLEAVFDGEGNVENVSPSASFDAAVRGWCKKHNIDAPWLLERATATVIDFARAEDELARLEYMGEHRLPPLPTAEDFDWSYLKPKLPGFSFHARAWALPEEAWDAFCTDVRRLLTPELARYRKRVLGDARPKSPGHRSPDGRHTMPHRHFLWLVRYQVRSQSYAHLARELKLDRKSVKDGIRDAATRVDLKLRTTSAGGRPMKRSGHTPHAE